MDYNDLAGLYHFSDALHNRLFSFAWDHGHSEGYHRVWEWYVEIADIFVSEV